jgi:hypothetical protein
MDLVKMPISKSGNKYTLTSMDYFKKWPHAVAIRDKLAETIASALYDICMVMGFPAVYSSDQERKKTKISISRSHLGFRPNHLVPENMFLASCTVLFYCNVQPARLYAGGTRKITRSFPRTYVRTY